MRGRGQLGVIGACVAPDHRRRRMPEQMLDVDLAGGCPDSHRREGVPEAVGVHVADAGATAQAVVEHDQALGCQAVPFRRLEERPRPKTSEGEVGEEGLSYLWPEG